MSLTEPSETVPAYSAQAPASVPLLTADYRDAYHNQAPPPPYPTALPDTFPISGKKYPPVVAVSELQFHLRILGAFATLRQNVTAEVGGQTEDADGAWAVFVARAVYRFYNWVIKVRPTMTGRIQDGQLPPVDVLMVWHSYLLVSGSMVNFSRPLLLVEMSFVNDTVYLTIYFRPESAFLLRRLRPGVPEPPNHSSLSSPRDRRNN